MRRAAAVILAALAGCIPRPAQMDERWKQVLSLPGEGAVMQLRASGARDLLIYSGNEDGLEEIAGASDLLMGSGWNLLTLHSGKAQTTNSADPASLRRAFYDFAAKRPGFERKVLVVAGRDLCLAAASMDLSSLEGLVVYLPEEAGFPDENCTRALGALKADLPVLFLKAPASTGMAFVLFSLVSSTSKEMRVEEALLPSIRTALFQGRLLTFLHLRRFSVSFVESRTTFRKGCLMLPSGPWVIAYVSGERAQGYCPLFLRSSGELYRAVDTLPDAGCDYGTHGAPEIRCR